MNLVSLGAIITCLGIALPWETGQYLYSPIKLSGLIVTGLVQVQNGFGPVSYPTQPWLLLAPICALAAAIAAWPAKRTAESLRLSLGLSAVALVVCLFVRPALDQQTSIDGSGPMVSTIGCVVMVLGAFFLMPIRRLPAQSAPTQPESLDNG